MLRLAATLVAASTLFDALALAQTGSPIASVEYLGGGTPGTNGIPVLGYDGAPIVGHPFAMKLERALPNSVAVFGASAPIAPFPVPEFGAVQHVGVPFALVIAPVDGEGRSEGFLELPQLMPSTSGIQFTAQALVADPGALGFLAFSSGLRLRIGEAAAEHAFEWRSYPGVGGSESILADFDGDGNLDVVGGVVDVTVRFGDGTGRFLAPKKVFASPPTDIDVLDLNDDGMPDVCASFTTSPYVRAAFSNGTNFTTASPSALSPNVTFFELGRVDGDDKPDLVAYNATADVVEVRLAVNDGQFGAPQSFAFAGDPKWMLLEDFDGDGFADLVLPNAAGGFSVFLCDGLGAFGAPTDYAAGTQVTTATAADFDDDGDLDIAFTNSNTLVSVLDNDGAGAFGSLDSVWVGGAPTMDVSAIDVDHDGLPDVAVTRGNLREVAFVRSKGQGKFAYLGSCVVSQIAWQLAIGDIDGDGWEDLALATLYGQSGGVSVRLRADGAFYGTPSSLGPFSIGNARLTASYIDGDDHLDFVAADPADDTVTTYLGDGAGGFAVGSTIAIAGEPRDVQMADLDSDGILDAVVAQGSAGIVTFRRGLGAGTFAPPTSLPATGWNSYAPSSVDVADVDGDGALDVVSTWYHIALSGHVISVWLGDGAGAFAPPFVTQGSNWLVDATTGDVDGDDLSDLVLVYQETGVGFVVGVRPSLGDGTFASLPTIPIAFRPHRAHLVHLDGDQHLDLVVVGEENVGLGQPTSWRAVAMLGNGDGTFAAALPISGTEVASTTQFTDLDGDTHLDLFAESIYGSAVWYGNGDGTFASPEDVWPRARVLGDFDGEGLPDTLVDSNGSPRVRSNRFVE